MPDNPGENISIVVTPAKGTVSYSKDGRGHAANMMASGGDVENKTDGNGRSLKSAGPCTCGVRPCCQHVQSCTSKYGQRHFL